MEVVTTIVTALALGAATGIKSVAEKGVKDAYNILKSLISSKYPDVGIESLEKKPNSEIKRKAVEEDLVDAGADKNIEVLQQAKVLLERFANLPVESQPAIGVNLEKVKAAALKIEDIIATGTGVNVQEGEFSGDIEIKQVRAGGEKENNPKSM